MKYEIQYFLQIQLFVQKRYKSFQKASIFLNTSAALFSSSE